jgi:hypothetical protein
MGGRRPEGNVTDTGNMRKDGMSRKERRIEASFERGQDSEGAVAT